MAVVAVLLNNKLYVANVGEPPVSAGGGGGLGEKASLGIGDCAFFEQLHSRYVGSAARRGLWVGVPVPLGGFHPAWSVWLSG